MKKSIYTVLGRLYDHPELDLRVTLNQNGWPVRVAVYTGPNARTVFGRRSHVGIATAKAMIDAKLIVQKGQGWYKSGFFRISANGKRALLAERKRRGEDAVRAEIIC